jgi:hypothetical protein
VIRARSIRVIGRRPISTIPVVRLVRLSAVTDTDDRAPDREVVMPPSNGPFVVLSLDGPSDGTVLARTIPRADPATTAQVTFSPPNRATRLRGVPSQFFNAPGPGEHLVATLPVPSAGQPAFTASLVVSDGTNGELKVPVTIQRASQ